ncbi:hypothetical protein [Frateuria soli]|uniref:hypothetical protein n=1 Tax=Frateuria soli TaxID=1542730 RepID=UPI001E55BB24|nr:hypothetical protein [Frateuria soli]UGB39123.1 hypothetical protein LQ771_04565 [Frateuria soli]
MAKKGSDWKDIDGKAAFVIPMTLLRHPNMAHLSPYGHKLIHDLGKQYTGFNNGYLCAAWSLMEGQGWRSSLTLHKAVLECEYYGLILRTQHGGRNKPNLHAFTWRRIDEKEGRPLQVYPGGAPSNAWKEVREKWVYEPPKVSQSHRSRKLRKAA